MKYRLYKATGKTLLGCTALRFAARTDAEAMEVAGAEMVRIDTLRRASDGPAMKSK